MKKIIIIAVVVVLLIVAAVAGYFLVFRSDSSEDEEVVYNEFSFEEDYSNIKDDSKILKYKVVVEYTGEGTLPKLNKQKTSIKSEFSTIMKSFSYEDLKKPTGEERVGQRIRQMIIEKLDTDEDTITNVYFPVFIIQG